MIGLGYRVKGKYNITEAGSRQKLRLRITENEMSQISLLQRIAARDAMNTLFEVGTGDAYLRVYDASNNVLLSEACNESSVMGATNGSGISTMAAPKSGTPWAALHIVPTAAGEASYGAITNRNGVVEERISVGLAASNAELKLNNLTIQLGVDAVIAAAPEAQVRETYTPA